MSEQRLSKIQKWILENCFRVTVLLDRTTLKKLNHITRSWQCKECPKTNENVRLTRNHGKIVTHYCVNDGFDCPYYDFYKEDILLSFFGLKPNNDIAHIHRVQHFHESPDYTKAHVTTHRSIDSLTEKGLIYAWSTFQEESLTISLADEGMKKAAELLGVKDFECFFE